VGSGCRQASVGLPDPARARSCGARPTGGGHGTIAEGRGGDTALALRRATLSSAG